MYGLDNKNKYIKTWINQIITSNNTITNKNNNSNNEN